MTIDDIAARHDPHAEFEAWWDAKWNGHLLTNGFARTAFVYVAKQRDEARAEITKLTAALADAEARIRVLNYVVNPGPDAFFLACPRGGEE